MHIIYLEVTGGNRHEGLEEKPVQGCTVELSNALSNQDLIPLKPAGEGKHRLPELST